MKQSSQFLWKCLDFVVSKVSSLNKIQVAHNLQKIRGWRPRNDLLKNTFVYLTIKRRSLNHITSSFSKMVSPSDLILSDHVTISLLPFKFCWSSSSTPSFSTKQQMTIFALVETSPQAVLRFSVYLVCFCPFALISSLPFESLPW